MRRIGLAALMALLVVNVWTGGPLLALWIGARVQSHTKSSLTIAPITAIVVFASLAAISVLLVKSLGRVSTAYDRIAGVAPEGRRRDSWVSVERRSYGRGSLTALERILVVMVVLAGLAFEVWFFFYSTSPIDGRSGRSAVPLAYQVPLPGRLDPANTKNQISNRNVITMQVVMNTRSH
jgi:hypothetical protein